MTDWQELLDTTGHRPYPLPSGRIKGTMSWHDLLFAHFRVDPGVLRDAVPRCLELDLWEGEAWVGVVPFYMTQVGLPRLNRLPWVSAFEELNVRTYVQHRGKAGVFFFSLDAASWLAVVGARTGFLLPYYWARMRFERRGPEVHFQSQRRVGPRASFEARYQPAGERFLAEAGSFEYWLTERYCLYTVDSAGEPYRCDIHHKPWPLQQAEAVIGTLDMTRAHGLALQGPPVLHFARQLDVLAWPLERAGWGAEGR